jgi:5-methyltetrahydrofolate--homocysteine methyltransferase
MKPDTRAKLAAEVENEYQTIRTRHANKTQEKFLSLAHARANALNLDWSGFKASRPQMLLQQDHALCEGACDHPHHHKHHAEKPALQYVKVLKDYPLDDLLPFIDWNPFFISWEFKARYPDILSHPSAGEAARKLWADAQAMLKMLVQEKWISASAVVGLFPANAVGDDVMLYQDESRQQVLESLCHLRQQGEHRAGVANKCLSDFVAPVSAGVDYVGVFACTTGIGCHERVQAFKDAHDDYSAILLESLADRLAEAFAERLHQRVRKEWWGYAADEELSNDELIGEAYQGIRPAPGYAACPEHTEKAKIWQLLQVKENIGMDLTESMAMWPAAAVSGWYFAHPQAEYFVVGRINKEQVQDYAARKGWTLQQAEKWLAPNLGYEPED